MADAIPAGSPPAAARDGRPPPVAANARSVVVRVLLLVAILGFVFVVVLPSVVDYGEVRDAIAALTVGQLLALGAATAVAYVANAAPCRVLVDGLSWPHAVEADLAARAVASTIPGPTDVATRFVLYSQWGIPAAVSSAGILFAAFFETLSALVLPLIAAIAVLVTGQGSRPGVVSLAVIGIAVLLVAGVVIAAIVRSEPLARRIGEALDWLAGHIWRLFRRTPPTGIVDAVLDFRHKSQDTLSRNGALGFAAAVVAKLVWFVVLEIALWTVGIGWDVLPPSAVLAAMAIVAIVALIPIVPGGVGITEVAYIGLLTAVAGDAYADQIAAAIMLYRIAQWLAPIPIGWVLLILLRRGRKGGLLGGTGSRPAGADRAAQPVAS
jgi:putative heme transporter